MLALLIPSAIARDRTLDSDLFDNFDNDFMGLPGFGDMDREFRQMDHTMENMDRTMNSMEMAAGKHGMKSFSKSESQEITEVNGKVHEKDTECVNGRCKSRVSNHKDAMAALPMNLRLAETSTHSKYAPLAGVIGFFVGSALTLAVAGRRPSTEGQQPLLSA